MGSRHTIAAGSHHKQHGNASGYHKNQKGHGHHPSWQKKRYKSYRHMHRPMQRYHKRYYHYKLHDNHNRRYKRNPHRDGFFFGMSFNDPYMKDYFHNSEIKKVRP